MKKRSGSKTSLELGRQTPNYTKSTASADARREQANVLGSSASEGSSGAKVCPYRRCSLNGHIHALLPPLKSFVSARRQTLKIERSILPTKGSKDCAKLIGRDEAATSDGEMCRDIDPRSSAQEAKTEILERPCIGSVANVNFHEPDSQSCDVDREKGKHYPTNLVHDYECTSKMKEECGEQGCKIITCAEFMISSDETLGNFFDEISADEVSQEFFDDESLNSDTLFNCESVGSYNYHDLKHESLPNKDLVDSATCKVIEHDKDHAENVCNQAEKCNAVHEVNLRNTEMSETKDKSSIKHEKSNQEADEPMCFNPREIHFLPLEPDPEAQKVSLRHQEQDARKNAEEWMVDYALREAVTKIGPTRQRKVASLVEAFERLLPTSKT